MENLKRDDIVNHIPCFKKEDVVARDLAMATRGKLNPSTETLAYFAGVLDSDGCIVISKMKPGLSRTKNPRYVLGMVVTNTSKVLMDWLVENFGGTYRPRRKVLPHHKTTYTWQKTNGHCVELLKLVAPHLRIKGDRAEVGIALIDGWKTRQCGPGAKTAPEEVARREALWIKMRELNQFGDAAATTNSLGSCGSAQDDVIV